MKRLSLILVVGLLVAMFAFTPLVQAGGREMANEILKNEPKPTPYPGAVSKSAVPDNQVAIDLGNISQGIRSINGRLEKMEVANKKRDGRVTALETDSVALKTDNVKNKVAIKKNADDIKNVGERVEMWGQYTTKEFKSLGNQIYNSGLIVVIVFLIIAVIFAIAFGFVRTIRRKP